MCGRYRRTTQEEELARLYHIPIPKQTDLPISYNIAPSQKVLTIRFNPETQARSLDALQWGLIPYWVKDPKIAYRTINARAETVDKAPSFRQAFRKRRCLIPADGVKRALRSSMIRFLEIEILHPLSVQRNSRL
jgi:putative SOS response-associated peptidase YedK